MVVVEEEEDCLDRVRRARLVVLVLAVVLVGFLDQRRIINRGRLLGVDCLGPRRRRVSLLVVVGYLGRLLPRISRRVVDCSGLRLRRINRLVEVCLVRRLPRTRLLVVACLDLPRRRISQAEVSSVPPPSKNLREVVFSVEDWDSSSTSRSNRKPEVACLDPRLVNRNRKEASLEEAAWDSSNNSLALVVVCSAVDWGLAHNNNLNNSNSSRVCLEARYSVVSSSKGNNSLHWDRARRSSPGPVFGHQAAQLPEVSAC